MTTCGLVKNTFQKYLNINIQIHVKSIIQNRLNTFYIKIFVSLSWIYIGI